MSVNFRRFCCGVTGTGPCLWNLLSIFAAASTKSEFELLPGAGHLPYEECPEVLTRIVNSYLVRMRESEAGPQLVRDIKSLS